MGLFSDYASGNGAAGQYSSSYIKIGVAGTDHFNAFTVQGGPGVISLGPTFDPTTNGWPSIGATRSYSTGLSCKWQNYNGDAASSWLGMHLWAAGGIRSPAPWVGYTNPAGNLVATTTAQQTYKPVLNQNTDTIITHQLPQGIQYMFCIWAQQYTLSDAMGFAADPYAFLAPPRIEIGAELATQAFGAYIDSGMVTVSGILPGLVY
jgi:hypothetical protein